SPRGCTQSHSIPLSPHLSVSPPHLSVSPPHLSLSPSQGYLDPEYYMSDLLTEKSDVFSFGIVLLEIATGLRPISDNQHIRQLVIKRVMAGGRGATAVIDPALLTAVGGVMEGEGGNVEVLVDGAGQSQGGSLGGIPEEVEATFEWFLKLGMRCSARLSQDRPTMQHVAAELDAMRARVIQIVRQRGGANDAGRDGGSGAVTGVSDAAAAGAGAGASGGDGTGVSSSTFNTSASSKANTGSSTGVSTTGATSSAFTGTGAVSEERFWEDMANEGALVPGFNDDEEEMEYGQEVYDNMTREKVEGQGRQGTGGVSGSVGGGGYTSSSSEGVWRAGGAVWAVWAVEGTRSAVVSGEQGGRRQVGRVIVPRAGRCETWQAWEEEFRFYMGWKLRIRESRGRGAEFLVVSTSKLGRRRSGFTGAGTPEGGPRGGKGGERKGWRACWGWRAYEQRR
ncbi:unnamed protein product, partial [Closterium sp. NIES-53]